MARDRVIGESLVSHQVQEPQVALRATAKSLSIFDRLVGLSVRPCPRAGCGKSARPVRRAGTGNGAWQTDIAPQPGKPRNRSKPQPKPPRQFSTLHSGSLNLQRTVAEFARIRSAWRNQARPKSGDFSYVSRWCAVVLKAAQPRPSPGRGVTTIGCGWRRAKHNLLCLC